MERKAYKNQVTLLLNILPEVAKEKCFALHGGTAINLFIRNMPRLSVDIDLTYLPIEDRENSFREIASALERIKRNIEKVVPGCRVIHKKEIAKLVISQLGADVKLEVNLVNRGAIRKPEELTLCERAQNEFEMFCTMPVIHIGQLFGGKIVAALDRQHPRDIFDVKYMLQKEGFSKEIKEGFLLLLLSSDRSINDLLMPMLKDQKSAMINQFTGMTEEKFEYDLYEETRESLIATIHNGLTDNDKRFLLGVKKLTPDWATYDFENFPAIKWKLRNLENLKAINPDKYKRQCELLEKNLVGISA